MFYQKAFTDFSVTFLQFFKEFVTWKTQVKKRVYRPRKKIFFTYIAMLNVV